MAKVIEIGVSSEGKAYRDGIEQDVIKPTEDAEKQLKEFGKAGDKAGDEIEKAMRGAQKESDRTRIDIEKMGSEIEQTARKSRTMGQGMREGTGEASDAVKEWSDEAKQNVSETFSSFDGSAESFVDMIQGTFGGVISNLGPVGAAAGAAGALGIGLMMSEFEKAKESEQEFREQVAELAGVLIETGGEGSDAVAAIADRLKNIATETDKNAMSFDKLRNMAKDMNVDFDDLAQAYVDGGGNLESYLGKLDDLIAKEQEAYAEQQKYQESAGLGTTYQGLQLEKTRDALKGVAEGYVQAEKDAAAWAESGGAAIAARAEQMDALQGELDEAIDGWGDYYDAETGATDPAAYIAAMQARMDATSNFNTNVQDLAATTGLSFEETQAILDQGVDFAPMLAAIMAGGPEMQAQYAGQIQAMLDGGQSIIDGTETTATITTKTDAQDAERQLDEAATERQAPVKATADVVAAEKSLDTVASKQRTAQIVASVDTSSAEAALSRFINRQRTATITAEVRTREGVLVP